MATSFKRGTRFEQKLLKASSTGSLKRVKKVLRDPRAVFYSASKGKGVEACLDGDVEGREKQGRSSKKRRCEKEGRSSAFVKYGLDVNCVDSNRWTPMHHAAFSGFVDIVKYLLKKGAKQDVKDACGNTPLILAAEKGHEATVSVLVAAGANMGDKNVFGKSAADAFPSPRAFFHTPHFRPPKEWNDRLQSAVLDDEVEFGNTSAWWEDMENDSPMMHEDDDTWRDEIAEAMKRKASAKHQSFFPKKKEDAKRDDNVNKEDPNSQWRKLLEEERLKDMEWRKNALETQSKKKLQEDYEKKWKQFVSSFSASSSCNVMFTVHDLPLPAVDEREENLRDVLLHGVPPEAQKKKMRMEILRWHPDKFAQIWGHRMVSGQEEQIMLKVKQICQRIHSLYSQISK